MVSCLNWEALMISNWKSSLETSKRSWIYIITIYHNTGQHT